MPHADLRLDRMTAPLHVDPAALLAAAAAQAGVAAAVANLDIGAALAGAADGMTDMASGAASRFAADAFDSAADTLHGGLATYASSLTAAAAAYQRADEELGGRLGDSLR